MKSADPVRSQLLEALAHLAQIYPEWRLGQTLANLAMAAGRMDAGGVWDLEDEEALAAARTLIEEHAADGTDNAALGAPSSPDTLPASHSPTAAPAPQQFS